MSDKNCEQSFFLTNTTEKETLRNAKAYGILRERRGSGEMLSVDLRRLMEKSFGYDLSAVRIHRDGEKNISRHLKTSTPRRLKR